jgi:hypothetical protein
MFGFFRTAGLRSSPRDDAEIIESDCRVSKTNLRQEPVRQTLNGAPSLRIPRLICQRRLSFALTPDGRKNGSATLVRQTLQFPALGKEATKNPHERIRSRRIGLSGHRTGYRVE